MRNKLKDKNPTHKIENPKRILSLEGISSSIDPVEMLKANKENGFSINRQEPCNLSRYNFTIETKAPFGGVECEKKFIYHKGKLSLCNFIKYSFDDVFEPQQMYEEIVKFNGNPDIIDFDKDIFLLQCTWNGSNGTITYDFFYNGTVVIIFELKDIKE